MGYNPVQGPNTYGSGCMPGAERLFAYMRETYQAGSLGCYNPASLGGRSLHAEGRAMDIALNANDPAQRARGDAILAAVTANPDVYGTQEVLWRGYLWSYQKRHLGIRGPGIQQADHMNHVHLGIDVNAARNWDRSWLGAVPSTPSPRKKATVATVVEAQSGNLKGKRWAVVEGGAETEIDEKQANWYIATGAAHLPLDTAQVKQLLKSV